MDLAMWSKTRKSRTQPQKDMATFAFPSSATGVVLGTVLFCLHPAEKHIQITKEYMT